MRCQPRWMPLHRDSSAEQPTSHEAARLLGVPVQGFDCQLEVTGPSSEGARGISPGWMTLHWSVVPQQGVLGPGVYFGVDVSSWAYEVR